MTSATSSEPQPGPPPTVGHHADGLSLRLKQRRHALELNLVGDLDLATAPRLLIAMEWLRRRSPRTIVLDTRDLAFVDIAGYRAFEESLNDADGTRDPRVVYVVGDVLARLQHHLMAATGIASPRLS